MMFPMLGYTITDFVSFNTGIDEAGTLYNSPFDVHILISSSPIKSLISKTVLNSFLLHI